MPTTLTRLVTSAVEKYMPQRLPPMSATTSSNDEECQGLTAPRPPLPAPVRTGFRERGGRLPAGAPADGGRRGHRTASVRR